MPFKSKLQARYMHYLESKGKLPKKIDLDEYDKETDFKHLPEEAMYNGGRVSSDGYGHLDEWDDEEWNEHDDDTSGEPRMFADGGEVLAHALMKRKKFGGKK